MPFILLIFLPFTLLPPLSLKEMATHSSILAWEILRTEKPGRLQSMRLQRVGHDLVTRKQQLLSPDTPTGSPSGGIGKDIEKMEALCTISGNVE